MEGREIERLTPREALFCVSSPQWLSMSVPVIAITNDKLLL
jgi:hypothetical protein